MKIALAIERMDTSRGGREMSTAQIAWALARRGHAVTILCQSGEVDPKQGVTLRALSPRGLTRTGRLANFVADVQKASVGRAFDIVHAMLPIPLADVYQPRGGTVPAQMEASLRRRQGLSRWSALATAPFNVHRNLMARLENQVMTDPRVLCLGVSEMVAREFNRYYGRTENVRTIYNAVDIPATTEADRARHRQELRQQIGAGPDETVFVTIATNFALKGVAELIDAFADWQKGDDGKNVKARLVMIGQGDAAKYKRQVEDRGVGRSVAFVPPARDVFPWYWASDACILLSWYDPCSRVVLEACRSGVPCVTTAFNGAGEVLAGGAGIVVSSPRDRGGIAKALGDLADPARHARRVEACGLLADKLSMDRHVDELLAAYETVIVRRGIR